MMDSDIDLDHPKTQISQRPMFAFPWKTEARESTNSFIEVAMTGLWKVALADKDRDSTDPSIKLELDLTYDREEKLRKKSFKKT